MTLTNSEPMMNSDYKRKQSEILDRFLNACCDYEGGIKVNLDGEYEAAAQALDALVLEVVNTVLGKGEVQNWDDESGHCMTCDFQPTDDTRNCICKFQNQLRAKAYQKAKELINAGEETE